MGISEYINRDGIKLAYVHLEAKGDGKGLPAVLFLCGLKSDMNGSKALFLEERCRKLGQEYLRFDYAGHGQSGGSFVEGTIGSWLEDVREIYQHVLQSSEVVIVGSSMGGWLALRLLVEPPQKGARIQGVIGIAAAPDFTRDIEAQITAKQRRALEEEGYFEQSNEYSDEPYIFTRSLLEDGRKQSLLNPDEPYKIDAALVLLQGKQDNVVYWQKALQIKQSFDAPSIEVVFIDDGDHSLSRAQDLIVLDRILSALC